MDQPILTYRLQRTRLWLGLTATGTFVFGAVFALAWTRTPDRPWFALLLVATVAIGWLALRSWSVRWHTAELLAGRPRLRVHSVRGSETFDLVDATLVLYDVTAAGKALNPFFVVPMTEETERRRSDLVIRTPERSLIIYARGRRCAALAELATRMQDALRVDLERVETVRSRLSYVGDTDGERPTVKLNPDAGTDKPSHMVGLTALAVVGVLLVLAVPVALQDPPYQSTVIASPQPRIDRFHDHLAAAGIDPEADTDDVAVTARWRDCNREHEWLWGRSGGVARLEVVAYVEVATSEVGGVQDRLDGLLERRDWSETSTNWRDDDLGQTVTFDDGRFETRLVHGCLPPRHHELAEAEFSAIAASWLHWLTDVSQS